jgi:hypothetical protein
VREFVLDEEKRYKFAGDVCHFDGEISTWVGVREWLQDEFQYFANAGLVTEFVEPMTIEVTMTVNDQGHGFVPGGFPDAYDKTFRGTLTEVQ